MRSGAQSQPRPNQWLQRTQQGVTKLACASLPPPCRAAEPPRYAAQLHRARILMTVDAIDSSWEARNAELWRTIDNFEPEAFVAAVDRLASELPEGNPVRLFERACAQDSTGHADLAVPLYGEALSGGLIGLRRRRAVIQMASSLRNLGNPAEAARLLLGEIDASSDELDGAVCAFLALALADLGREREALGYSLGALSVYLPRYNRSLARYAAELAASGGSDSNAA